MGDFGPHPRVTGDSGGTGGGLFKGSVGLVSLLLYREIDVKIK